MSKHPMSVFRWTFTRRYALRHPIRIIRWFMDALKQRKQRAINGWCMNDATDWYNWAAYVLAGLLREISENDVIPEKRAEQIRGIAEDIADAVLDTTDDDRIDEEYSRVYNDTKATEDEKQEAFERSVREKRRVLAGKRCMASDAFRELGEIFFDFFK